MAIKKPEIHQIIIGILVLIIGIFALFCGMLFNIRNLKSTDFFNYLGLFELSISGMLIIGGAEAIRLYVKNLRLYTEQEEIKYKQMQYNKQQSQRIRTSQQYNVNIENKQRQQININNRSLPSQNNTIQNRVVRPNRKIQSNDIQNQQRIIQHKQQRNNRDYIIDVFNDEDN